jgi:hypothetical protein
MLKEWYCLVRVKSNEFNRCPCGTHIKELCWIKNYITNKTIFIGNECIKYITDEMPYCGSCELYRIPTLSSHYCTFCARNKKDKPTGFILRGKYAGKTYKYLFENEGRYCSWCRTERKGDVHFLAFLDMQYDRIVREEAFKRNLSNKNNGLTDTLCTQVS